MSHSIPSTFSKYSFTDDEEIQCTIFSDLQLQYFQTEQAIAAEAALALEYNPDQPLQFLQADAVYKSKVATLQGLIDAHTRSVEYLKNKAAQSSSDQSQN